MGFVTGERLSPFTGPPRPLREYSLVEQGVAGTAVHTQALVSAHVRA